MIFFFSAHLSVARTASANHVGTIFSEMWLSMYLPDSGGILAESLMHDFGAWREACQLRRESVLRPFQNAKMRHGVSHILCVRRGECEDADAHLEISGQNGSITC